MENELSREQIEECRRCLGSPAILDSTLNTLCDMALAYLDANALEVKMREQRAEFLAVIEFATNLDAEGAQFLNDWSYGGADEWAGWKDYRARAMKGTGNE